MSSQVRPCRRRRSNRSSSSVVQEALFRSLSLLECIRSLGDADADIGIDCGDANDRDLSDGDLCSDKVVEEKADR